MQRYFSTTPVFSAPSDAIDRASGSIKGVIVAQLGLAKGHGGYIDKTFLLQIVENTATKSAGIKARFGHPNMCSSAMGTYLGRFKNYSYTGDQVKADLFLDDTAKKTPGGDLYSYVFDMAEKNPDMFGASIVFSISDSEIVEETVDNKKVKKEYFRLAELMATDLVDSPAATDGLFSANTFPGIATQFLDENPEILDLIFSKPESIIEFLSNYLTNSKMNFPEKIKQNFATFLAAFSNSPTVHSALSTEHSEDSTLNILFDAFKASYPESFSEVEGFTQLQKAEALTAFIESNAARLTELTESFSTLQADHEALVSSAASTVSELEQARETIASLNDQLSARPSIPLNVTDPALSIPTASLPKDETGKQLLSQLPKDLKRKLANSSKTTE